jgi:hypothetical protein
VAAPTYDMSGWPLCRVSWPRVMRDGELDAHWDYLETFLLKGEPFALLIDARGAAHPSSRQRQIMGRRLAQNFQCYPLGMTGIAMVLSSAIERGMLTAVNWVSGPAYTIRAFRTPELAVVWLNDTIPARGAAACNDR